MTTKSSENENSHLDHENKFVKEQPLRHSLAVVGQDDDKIKINQQTYQLLINKRDALDIEMLRQKYDPYLDQYDFLVGDVSSEHLRLKGFYRDNMRTAIDRKEQTIADYLMEYCNPGAGYFILQLMNPVHHYRTKQHKNWHRAGSWHRQGAAAKHSKTTFKRRKVYKTSFKKHETVAVKKERSNHHSFVIKKRKGSK
ncbi:YutD family protein [Lactobacillus sp. ESL0785]|uniref:YutD family protein n=1 Tax=Lactobacillus sp. ESL0785 TaxID=2983232 RepID=UPI0023F86203|nr:YutD family protein [Lactobacillus sp. ESL0785]WEV71231.1 YutD family protein [Lactobacillus sp. ESL0785]